MVAVFNLFDIIFSNELTIKLYSYKKFLRYERCIIFILKVLNFTNFQSIYYNKLTIHFYFNSLKDITNSYFASKKIMYDYTVIM